MRRTRVGWVALVVVGLTVVPWYGTLAGMATTAEHAGTPGWRLFQYFGGCSNSEVDSVTSNGPDSAWATGGWIEGAECDIGRFDARWDGNSWRDLSPPADVDLGAGTAIAALSDSYSWTFVAQPSSFQPPTQSFALLHDGGRWRAFRLAKHSGITSAAVFSRFDAWAFGSISRGSIGYAVRFNGRTWRRVAVPIAVQAASAAGPTSIWVVGRRTVGGGLALAHWTGRWTAHRFPDLHLPSGQVISQAWVVRGDGGGAWVTATITQPDKRHPDVGGVLLHWTGGKWARVALPVQVAAMGPLAHDGHGGLWITSYPAVVPPDNDNLDMLHYSRAGTWAKTVVPVQELVLNSMRLIPGTTSLWAGGYVISDADGGLFAVVVKYGR